MDYIKEQDNLTRQLHLLQCVTLSFSLSLSLSLSLSKPLRFFVISLYSDANKQLHDTNDNLRVAIESRGKGQRLSIAVSFLTLHVYLVPNTGPHHSHFVNEQSGCKAIMSGTNTK